MIIFIGIAMWISYEPNDFRSTFFIDIKSDQTYQVVSNQKRQFMVCQIKNNQ